jgi:hypothetical protein
MGNIGRPRRRIEVLPDTPAPRRTPPPDRTAPDRPAPAEPVREPAPQ